MRLNLLTSDKFTDEAETPPHDGKTTLKKSLNLKGPKPRVRLHPNLWKSKRVATNLMTEAEALSFDD